jgi:hypothetical protein
MKGMGRGYPFAWVCLFGACSSTPDLVYQGSLDGSAPDATTSDSATGTDSATTDAGGGNDTGTGNDGSPPNDAGVDAPVDAPPDGWNTCPGTPPPTYKCCPGTNKATACLGPCDDAKCQQCADAGCGTTLVCCTTGGSNPSKCINYGAACP